MARFSFRRDLITKPIFGIARGALPHLSDTEREAIEAGDVWWDADLFAGDPDWAKLLAFAPAKLSDEERQFLAGPVEELCSMLDDWQINWTLRDLPPEVWAYLKAKKFFAMIIPKEYGGLGFSRLRALRGDSKTVVAVYLGRCNGDGAKFTRPRRVVDSIWHQGATGLLAAAARQRRGDTLLRIDQPGGRL